MNYYISDLHLFHEAAIRFDDRPFRDLEEMHAEIVKRWNEKVNNGQRDRADFYSHVSQLRGSGNQRAVRLSDDLRHRTFSQDGCSGCGTGYGDRPLH